MKTEILLDHEPAADGGYIVRALLRVHGEEPERGERTPLNLGIVLDRSGSMHGEPLEYAKEAAALLVRRLSADDVVSVVAYDDRVLTVAEPATGEAQLDLPAQIAAIQSGRTTNLSGGWLRGRELVARSRLAGAMHRLLLLTDGLANVGITDHDSLVGLSRQGREDGITTTTIGFGPGYDERLLRAMAEAGGGAMYYIEHADQAPAVFAEEIEGLLSLSAQDVTVEVRPTPAARLVLVHHRYPSQPIGDALRIEMGDVYARDPRQLLAEFFVRDEGAAPEALTAIAELVITAHVMTPGGGVERREVRAPIRASLAEGPRTDPEVRREMLLQEAARAREEAYQAQREGDYDRARARLEEAAGSLAPHDLARQGLDDDDELAGEAEELRTMAESFRQYTVTEADAKYLYQRGYARRTSRDWTARAVAREGRGEGRGKGEEGREG